jgi:hypothetical protein
MNKIVLLSLPMIALALTAGIAYAQPFGVQNLQNLQNMTHEQKNLMTQKLSLQQQMIQDRISFISGNMTQDLFQDRLQTYMDSMQQIKDQMRNSTGCINSQWKHMGSMGMHGQGIGMGQMKRLGK